MKSDDEIAKAITIISLHKSMMIKEQWMNNRRYPPPKGGYDMQELENRKTTALIETIAEILKQQKRKIITLTVFWTCLLISIVFSLLHILNK